MTPEILIAEGRRLARPCVFLRPRGDGPVAAIWHGRDAQKIEATGYRCWITVDARFVPGLPKAVCGYLSVLTDEQKTEGGRVEVQPVLPKRRGIELHASEEFVLPPIEAVFMHGSEAIGEWLAEHAWPRDERYCEGFPDSTIVR